MLFTCLLLASCNGPRYAAKAESSAESIPTAVRVESPRSGNEVDFRAPLSGTVQSSAQVQLGFQLSGEVAAVLVEEGEQVKAGQLLARLEDDLYQAQV